MTESSSTLLLKPYPEFIGREEILAALRRMHVANFARDGNGPTISVLTGLGGVGKTLIALKFAHEFKIHYSTPIVCLLDASSKATLKKGLANIFPPNDYQESLKMLAEADEEWLLILDNLKNPLLDIMPYIPRSTCGHIIITTRDAMRALLAPKSSHQIGGLSDEDATHLLLTTSGNEINMSNRAYASVVCEQLGNHPQAIVHAAVYIRNRRCLTRYCDMYRSNPLLHLQYCPPKESNSQSIAQLIESSFVRLTKGSQDMLRILSYMDINSLSRSMIDASAHRQFIGGIYDLTAPEEESNDYAKKLQEIFNGTQDWPYTFNQRILECSNNSLINLRKGENGTEYSMHPLVRAYSQATIIGGKVRCDSPSRLAARLLGSALGEHLRENILPHLLLVRPADVIEPGDCYGFALLLNESGHDELARTYGKRCARLLKEQMEHQYWGKLTPKTPLDESSRGQQISILESRRKLLDVSITLLGERSSESLDAMYTLSQSFEILDMQQELIELLQRVLPLFEATFGSEHTRTKRFKELWEQRVMKCDKKITVNINSEDDMSPLSPLSPKTPPNVEPPAAIPKRPATFDPGIQEKDVTLQKYDTPIPLVVRNETPIHEHFSPLSHLHPEEVTHRTELDSSSITERNHMSMSDAMALHPDESVPASTVKFTHPSKLGSLNDPLPALLSSNETGMQQPVTVGHPDTTSNTVHLHSPIIVSQVLRRKGVKWKVWKRIKGYLIRACCL